MSSGHAVNTLPGQNPRSRGRLMGPTQTNFRCQSTAFYPALCLPTVEASSSECFSACFPSLGLTKKTSSPHSLRKDIAAVVASFLQYLFDFSLFSETLTWLNVNNNVLYDIVPIYTLRSKHKPLFQPYNSSFFFFNIITNLHCFLSDNESRKDFRKL